MSPCVGGANPVRVLNLTATGIISECRDAGTLPYPASSCATSEITVIFPASAALDAGGLCLRRDSGPMGKCSGDGDCAGGAHCAPLFEGDAGTDLFRLRWHLHDVGAPSDLSACAGPCDTVADSTTDACLVGVAPAKATAPLVDRNHPSGGLRVPRAFLDRLATDNAASCAGPIILFPRAGDAGGKAPIAQCSVRPHASVPSAAGFTVVAPGSAAPAVGPDETAVCQDPAVTSTGANSSVAPLGYAFVCAQEERALTEQQRFPCGRVGIAAQPAGTTYTCAAIGGLVTGTPVAPAGVAPETQCASGVVQAGACAGRNRGGLCADPRQCGTGANGGCGAQTRRCGQLLTPGANIPGGLASPNDPTIFQQCIVNAYSGTQDVCEFPPGAPQSTPALCASGAISAGACAVSGLGKICGQDDDCSSSQCLVEERRCVAGNNNGAVDGASCPSGNFSGGACAPGERGEACVDAGGASTCKPGLACLDDVCR